MPTQNAASDVCEVQLTEGPAQLPETVEKPLPVSAHGGVTSRLGGH